jgi:hypothetical protein
MADFTHANDAKQFWGAHASSRARFGALAETLVYGRNYLGSGVTKVRDGEGAIASTRGACAPQEDAAD